MTMRMRHLLCGLMVLALPVNAFAQAGKAPPLDVSPPPGDPVGEATAAAQVAPVVPPPPAPSVVRHWPVSNARALLAEIERAGVEGLDPADYRPAELRQAIAGGEGPLLDDVASRSFRWLVEDLRDGRTPMEARKQWFVVDPDPDTMPTAQLMDDALATGDIRSVLARLAPFHPDYALLKAELARTPAAQVKQRAMIRANMDRWRWLPQYLGRKYLLTNVPEFQLRLTVNDKIIRTYRTIVGKPGKTATPQLAEEVEGVIFNPTWTVPQSIVVGEGLGKRLLSRPGQARAEGYKVTRAEDGTIIVVQQPGPNNALGLMKLDMPNEHAIFLHDTPGKQLFYQDDRALSHGCIRTERASELAMTLAILQAGLTPEEGVAHNTSGIYTKVPFTKTIPVYITYFTMARDIEGKLSTFPDLYDRDAPVLESLRQARVETRARVTSEEVVPLEDPGV